MTTRICPNCSEKLDPDNNFFCSNCGNELPANLVKRPDPIKTKDYSSAQPLLSTNRDKPTHNFVQDANLLRKEENSETNVSIREQHNRAFKVRTGILLAGVIIFALVLFGVIRLLVNYASQEVKSDLKETVYENSVNLSLELESGDFNSTDLAGYVPSDALVYIEGNDLHGFTSNYVTSNSIEIPAVVYSQIPELFTKNFVAFAVEHNDKIEWFVVLQPVEGKEAEVEYLASTFDHDYLRFKMIEGNLVVSTHGDLFNLVESPKNYSERGFILNPEYAKSKTKVENNGQFLFIFGDFEKGKQALLNMAAQNTGQLQEVLNAIVEQNFNELVIKGN